MDWIDTPLGPMLAIADEKHLHMLEFVERKSLQEHVDRYRKEWRSNPRYQSDWSKIFNWGSDAINDWKLLSTVSFEGRRDAESSYAGWRGEGPAFLAAGLPSEVEATLRCFINIIPLSSCHSPPAAATSCAR